jgi:hypothetical protein
MTTPSTSPADLIVERPCHTRQAVYQQNNLPAALQFYLHMRKHKFD